MTTIKQLIQAGPSKATELFTRLVDTTEGAVKTREKLFAELKEELELLAQVDEKHLFPVLRKHKDTKDIVAGAIDDNKRMRKLIAELDRTPRDSEEFSIKIAEMRRIFQQHVRDEKKELLPAVLKALTDEEAQTIVDGIEDRKSAIEEEKRAEAAERRSAAREERERAETFEKSAETVVAALWMVPRAASRTAQTAENVTRKGVDSLATATQQAFEVLNRTGAQAQQNLTLLSEASNIFARAFQDLSREWLGLVQERMQRNMDGMTTLARCRSLPDLVAAQTDLMRDGMQQALEGARRMGVVTTRVASQATASISERVPSDAQRPAA